MASVHFFIFHNLSAKVHFERLVENVEINLITPMHKLSKKQKNKKICLVFFCIIFRGLINGLAIVFQIESHLPPSRINKSVTGCLHSLVLCCKWSRRSGLCTSENHPLLCSSVLAAGSLKASIRPRGKDASHIIWFLLSLLSLNSWAEITWCCSGSQLGLKLNVMQSRKCTLDKFQTKRGSHEGQGHFETVPAALW